MKEAYLQELFRKLKKELGGGRDDASARAFVVVKATFRREAAKLTSDSTGGLRDAPLLAGGAPPPQLRAAVERLPTMPAGVEDTLRALEFLAE